VGDIASMFGRAQVVVHEKGDRGPAPGDAAAGF
jgi:hypothetical protein